ncbi:MAG: ABC transporter ATP-binding protein [Anaerolineae bacterium]|nr:ABC transporter ATP-binding protein [Anaerolineae bacterium]MDW8103191.1 ABC transporter ATP-binding protein [Anaerolineae bacterium]
MVSNPAVKMVNIVKKFPGVIANDHINFEAAPGEIHALLGENGAGKTTLMNILYGIYQADEGEIYINGHRVYIRSPRDAIALGIGMVHQHFHLIPSHTVGENIVLGLPGNFFFPLERARKEIEKMLEQYGLKVDVDAYVWQLSAGEKQRVEIAKALYRNARILILDEPTTMLTPSETEELFAALKRMAGEGRTIIFITHKLREVIEVSDRVTVLRKGKVVGSAKTSEVTIPQLAEMMVGEQALCEITLPPVEKGKVVLEVKDLCALNDKGLQALKNISFSIREGEIFGIAGVAGNGQKELVEVITGLRKATSGCVLLNGKDITNVSPKEIVDLGVAHVPEERISVGLAPSMSVLDNLLLKFYRHPPFCYGFLLNYRKASEFAESKINEFEIITPSKNTPAKFLSGGNIQRLILARETSGRPKLIVAAHPTYGLDIKATDYVRRRLIEQRSRGAAILLISEDLEEVICMSDRIAVMFEGQLMGIMDAQEADIKTIGLMMAGVKPEAC